MFTGWTAATRVTKCPGDRGIDVVTYYRGRGSFVGAVGSLIGHIAATAILFVAIMAATWAISWAFSYLNAIHQFPLASQKILTYLEEMNMSDFTAAFTEGFVGAFRLAAAIVVGVSLGAYRFFSRLGRQFTHREPLL